MTDDLGTVRWFGQSWQAPVCDPRTHVGTPSGRSCIECGVPIDDDDQGVTVPHLGMPDGPRRATWHLKCWLASVLGPDRLIVAIIKRNPEIQQ